MQDRLPLFRLLEPQPLQVQSSHLSFQEYFAACALRDGATLSGAKPWQWPAWWSNALTIGVEMGDEFRWGLLRAAGETGDTLDITPMSAAALGDTSICTYHDHRMAMCFATLGLAVAGLKIEDPSCVRKTVPSFFQMLAAPPPNGLGVVIWECDPKTKQRVRQLTDPADLFAAK